MDIPASDQRLGRIVSHFIYSIYYIYKHIISLLKDGFQTSGIQGVLSHIPFSHGKLLEVSVISTPSKLNITPEKWWL